MIQGDWLPLHSRKLSLILVARYFSINLESKFAIVPQKIMFGMFYVIKSWIGYFLFILIFTSVSDIFIEGRLTSDPVKYTLAIVVGIMIRSLFVSVKIRTEISQRIYINQGFANTIKLGSIIGLTVGVVFSVWMRLSIGLIAGLAYGLLHGNLSEVVKHVILRIILFRKKLAPRRYDCFLQQMIDQRIMRRVGGSVFFVHRYILEYFADQWEKKYQNNYEC